MSTRKVAGPVLASVNPGPTLVSSREKDPRFHRPRQPRRHGITIARRDPADRRESRSISDGTVPPQIQRVWRLASGVANDFNNILQVIGGNAETVLQRMDAADPQRHAVQAILDAARRASALTQQLLAIGRRQVMFSAPLDVSAFVSEALPRIRKRVRSEIRFVTHLSAKLPPVQVDRGLLLEVLLHLADHASDSMPDGGTLSIVTDVVNVGAQMRHLRPWLRVGRFVRVELADSGKGLDPQMIEELFEPFQAAKSRRGGGLGLSAAYGIIKQSGGFIWVESEHGQGSRITILLPVAPIAGADDEEAERPKARVLLVEDDDDVRELLDSVLMHHGYSVAAYGTAEDALEHSAPFDMLVSDVTLPGLAGPALAREITRRTPDVPILLISGDAANVGDISDFTPRGFLQKPFSTETLVSRVEELLAR